MSTLNARDRQAKIRAKLHALKTGNSFERPKRTYYWHEKLNVPNANGYGSRVEDTMLRTHEGGKHNLVGSLCENGKHAPAIDIDLPIEAIPSSTPGHFHLYIDKEMTQSEYFELLEVMAKVGIVEPGFVEASKRNGMSTLRPPGEYKTATQHEIRAVQEKNRQLAQTVQERSSQIVKANEEIAALRVRLSKMQQKQAAGRQMTWS